MNLLFLFLLPAAFGQAEIPVEETTPCFLDFDKGTDIFTDCGLEDDFLVYMTTPFEYATGGFFSMILITLLIIITYMKYHKMAYPLMLGLLYFPAAWFLLPTAFVTFALILSGVAIAIMFWLIFIRQTTDK